MLLSKPLGYVMNRNLERFGMIYGPKGKKIKSQRRGLNDWWSKRKKRKLTGTARSPQLASTRKATPFLKMMFCVMSNINKRILLCSVEHRWAMTIVEVKVSHWTTYYMTYLQSINDHKQTKNISIKVLHHGSIKGMPNSNKTVRFTFYWTMVYMLCRTWPNDPTHRANLFEVCHLTAWQIWTSNHHHRRHHHHHHLFLKRPSVQPQTRIRCLSHVWSPFSLHASPSIAHSGCNPSNFMSSFRHSPPVFPHISPLPPQDFYRPTPNHPNLYNPNVQTTSICHASPHQPNSEHLGDCTNPYCTFYHSKTLHTSTSPLCSVSYITYIIVI